LLAVHAAERARSGVDAAAIISELEILRPHTRTFAYVRDLQPAVRGGRIPAWALPLTRWLRLVPIAAVSNRDGRLHVRGVAIASSTLATRFVRSALRGLDRKARWRAQVMHCDNPAEGLQVRAALIEQLPGVECSVLFDAGSAIGAHAGQGAVVLSLMPVLEVL
jgi:fatty acid-binding protein DegV